MQGVPYNISYIPYMISFSRYVRGMIMVASRLFRKERRIRVTVKTSKFKGTDGQARRSLCLLDIISNEVTNFGLRYVEFFRWIFQEIAPRFSWINVV